jgi:hypothetical protein
VAVSVVGCSGLRPVAPPIPRAGLAPWEIPRDALGTRRLLRLSYEGPDASASVKLVLELLSPETFAVRVFDRFGRKVWEARSDRGSTLVVAHEANAFCRLRGAVRWVGLEPLGPLEPTAIPALLLGRVPGRPGPGVAAETDAAGRFAYRGTGPETWTGRQDAGGIASWTLLRGDEPRWWWSRSASGGLLSQRREGRQIRWELVTVEPLTDLPGLEAPVAFRERCDQAGPAADADPGSRAP